MSFVYKKFPEEPGVYLMKNVAGRVLYVGKAGNLRRRISSYFAKPHDYRIQKLVGQIKKIDYKKTDTALEALILEARLIKKYQPPFNVREKDDKSFLYVEITSEAFPRVLLARGKNAPTGERFGPFASASSIREALRILRKIFPWNTHEPNRIGQFVRPCFDYEIGLCPGTCVNAISHSNYLKVIKNLRRIFLGQKKKIIKNLKLDMLLASKSLDFERAQKVRRQIFNLEHIQDVALISDSEPVTETGKYIYRIEGYDISDISGTSAVGSMVVFGNEFPDKNEYRKFKIRTIRQADDVGMIKEVIRRRLRNHWPLPRLMFIDGGKGQVNAAKSVLLEFGLKIPVVGIAKGPKRKRNDIVGIVPNWIGKKTLIKVRDEAHRFAVSYHKRVRSKKFLT